jgi:hypothetical protein
VKSVHNASQLWTHLGTLIVFKEGMSLVKLAITATIEWLQLMMKVPLEITNLLFIVEQWKFTTRKN